MKSPFDRSVGVSASQLVDPNVVSTTLRRRVAVVGPRADGSYVVVAQGVNRGDLESAVRQAENNKKDHPKREVDTE